jgi:hypothetical protein
MSRHSLSPDGMPRVSAPGLKRARDTAHAKDAPPLKKGWVYETVSSDEDQAGSSDASPVQVVGKGQRISYEFGKDWAHGTVMGVYHGKAKATSTYQWYRVRFDDGQEMACDLTEQSIGVRWNFGERSGAANAAATPIALAGQTDDEDREEKKWWTLASLIAGGFISAGVGVISCQRTEPPMIANLEENGQISCGGKKFLSPTAFQAYCFDNAEVKPTGRRSSNGYHVVRYKGKPLDQFRDGAARQARSLAPSAKPDNPALAAGAAAGVGTRVRVRFACGTWFEGTVAEVEAGTGDGMTRCRVNFDDGDENWVDVGLTADEGVEVIVDTKENEEADEAAAAPLDDVMKLAMFDRTFDRFGKPLTEKQLAAREGNNYSTQRAVSLVETQLDQMRSHTAPSFHTFRSFALPIGPLCIVEQQGRSSKASGRIAAIVNVAACPLIDSTMDDMVERHKRSSGLDGRGWKYRAELTHIRMLEPPVPLVFAHYSISRSGDDAQCYTGAGGGQTVFSVYRFPKDLRAAGVREVCRQRPPEAAGARSESGGSGVSSGSGGGGGDGFPARLASMERLYLSEEQPAAWGVLKRLGELEAKLLGAAIEGSAIMRMSGLEAQFQ